MAKISTLLDLIDLGSIALPEFQRGYVWNRDEVGGLMHSLYRGYPVGSLLVWETPTNLAPARGDQALQPGVVKLLRAGQGLTERLFRGNLRTADTFPVRLPAGRGSRRRGDTAGKRGGSAYAEKRRACRDVGICSYRMGRG